MNMDEKKHTIVEKNFEDRLKYAKSKNKDIENNKNNEKELYGKHHQSKMILIFQKKEKC